MTSRPEKKLKKHYMLNIQQKITSPKKTKEHEMLVTANTSTTKNTNFPTVRCGIAGGDRSIELGWK